jgi:hypothetical protein
MTASSAGAARWRFLAGSIHRMLAADHRRLDDLLERATVAPGRIEPEPYAEFRAGLLKHIAMEEKILLPAAQRRRGGAPLAVAATLRLQHGAIAALLVPTPTPDVIATLRVVLRTHNPLEEGRDGMYDACEAVLEDEVDAILADLRAAPAVPVASHVDGAMVLRAARRALARAGFDVDALPLVRQE